MTTPPILPFPETVVVRVAGRHGMTFFLNVLRIVCDGRDLLDSLILMTIGQANLSHLDRDPRHQALFADYAHPLDPALLRPISTNAVAATLSQPFETVRRRTVKLRSAASCVMTDRGLIIPPEHLVSARAHAVTFAINQQVRILYANLRELGVLRATVSLDRSPPRPRAVARLAIDYVLRQLEAMSAQISDPTVGILLIHVIRATTDHLDDTFTEFSETEDLVDDRLRRPASAAFLADRAGLPRETARRHMAELLERGWIAHAPKSGYHLSREMLRSAPWPKARRDNVANLNRMFDALSSLEPSSS